MNIKAKEENHLPAKIPNTSPEGVRGADLVEIALYAVILIICLVIAWIFQDNYGPFSSGYDHGNWLKTFPH